MLMRLLSKRQEPIFAIFLHKYIMQLYESSFRQLYQSAVDAYPDTTKRQHVTGTIKITELIWTPFLGMRTLLLRANADNSLGGGGKYRPIIMFKNVEYHAEPGTGIVEITSDGQNYYLSPLSRADNGVLVRCGCKDLHWRFKNEDFQDKSLFSSNRKPYEAISDRGPVNPTHAIGVCKHLMRTMEVLMDAGIVVH